MTEPWRGELTDSFDCLKNPVEDAESGKSLEQELQGGSLLQSINPQIVIAVYASIYRRGVSRRNSGKSWHNVFSDNECNHTTRCVHGDLFGERVS